MARRLREIGNSWALPFGGAGMVKKYLRSSGALHVDDDFGHRFHIIQKILRYDIPM